MRDVVSVGVSIILDAQEAKQGGRAGWNVVGTKHETSLPAAGWTLEVR